MVSGSRESECGSPSVAIWLLVIALATIVDLLIRIETDFDMPRVLAGEAILFLSTAAVLAALRFRWPAAASGGRAWQTVLVWSFGLAGIRSGLIAAGLPILWSNSIPVAIALLRYGAHRRKLGGGDA
jgi:hypothetical protein